LQGELTCDEIIIVKRQTIKQCQQQAFADENKAMQNNMPFSEKNKHVMLNPFLKKDDLIRSNSH
jgi:hypothetical protein